MKIQTMVDHNLMDWEGTGEISPSGDTAAYGYDAAAEPGLDLDISSHGSNRGICPYTQTEE